MKLEQQISYGKLCDYLITDEGKIVEKLFSSTYFWGFINNILTSPHKHKAEYMEEYTQMLKNRYRFIVEEGIERYDNRNFPKEILYRPNKCTIYDHVERVRRGQTKIIIVSPYGKEHTAMEPSQSVIKQNGKRWTNDDNKWIKLDYPLYSYDATTYYKIFGPYA